MLETAPEYCDCIEKKYTLYERVDVMRQILFFSLFFLIKKIPDRHVKTVWMIGKEVK